MIAGTHSSLSSFFSTSEDYIKAFSWLLFCLF